MSRTKTSRVLRLPYEWHQRGFRAQPFCVGVAIQKLSRCVAHTSISTTVRPRYCRLRRDRHLALRACLCVPSDVHCLTSGVLAVRRRHDPKDAGCLTGGCRKTLGSRAPIYLQAWRDFPVSRLLLSLLLYPGISLCLPLSCSCSEKVLLSAENDVCRLRVAEKKCGRTRILHYETPGTGVEGLGQRSPATWPKFCYTSLQHPHPPVEFN